MFFHAFRADAVGELGIRMFTEILLNLLPGPPVIADLFAKRANRLNDA